MTTRRDFIAESTTVLLTAGFFGLPFVMRRRSGQSLESKISNTRAAPTPYHQWIDETIAASAQNRAYAITVNKTDYALHLYKNGRLVKTYPIELGFNPVDDKVRQGDGCTPEGQFYIAHKNPHSSFHKALLLSYPTTEDAERGLQSRLITPVENAAIIKAITQKQIPPQNTPLGGFIEIHGSGSGRKGNDGGRNWTLGCIAVSNEHIEELYGQVKEKTPVTIVQIKQSHYLVP